MTSPTPVSTVKSKWWAAFGFVAGGLAITAFVWMLLIQVFTGQGRLTWIEGVMLLNGVWFFTMGYTALRAHGVGWRRTSRPAP